MIKSVLANEIMVHIFRLNKTLLDKGDLLVEPLGLTSARWQVLGALSLSERPLTVPQIARFMGISRQSVQKQIDKALKEALCMALTNPDHARSALFQLTPKGNDIFKQVMIHSNQWGENITETMDHSTLETLLQGLIEFEEQVQKSLLPSSLT